MTALNERALQAVANAIDDTLLAYSIKLTSLVDGVSTYTLALEDEASRAFALYADAYDYVKKRTSEARARAAIEAYHASDGAVAVERAECLKIAEASIPYHYVSNDSGEWKDWQPGSPYDRGQLYRAQHIAAAIRARSQP